jgi:uncharacterized SAM-binding protein YcdF (DUF218 family)
MEANGDRGRHWVALGLLIVVIGPVALGWWTAVHVGQWLVVQDQLERASAILVLGGDPPFRAVEAGAVYRRGLAPEVWLVRRVRPTADAAFARLGIKVSGEPTTDRLVLERVGVPSSVIRLLPRPAVNTTQELRVAGEELRRLGARRLIVVTSKAHSRRVRATWHVLFPDLDARIRVASDDPYDGRYWWRRTHDALAVSREVSGLLNVWAGFPVLPESP